MWVAGFETLSQNNKNFLILTKNELLSEPVKINIMISLAWSLGGHICSCLLEPAPVSPEALVLWRTPVPLGLCRFCESSMLGAGNSLILPELGTRMELPARNDVILNWGTMVVNAGSGFLLSCAVNTSLELLLCDHSFRHHGYCLCSTVRTFLLPTGLFHMIACASCFVPGMLYDFFCPYSPQNKDGPHIHPFICLPTEVEGMAGVVLIGYTPQLRP